MICCPSDQFADRSTQEVADRRESDQCTFQLQCDPKCSKSRDLTAIAICDSNRESQITSDLRQCEPYQKSSLFSLVV